MILQVKSVEPVGICLTPDVHHAEGIITNARAARVHPCGTACGDRAARGADGAVDAGAAIGDSGDAAVGVRV